MVFVAVKKFYFVKNGPQMGVRAYLMAQWKLNKTCLDNFVWLEMQGNNIYIQNCAASDPSIFIKSNI